MDCLGRVEGTGGLEKPKTRLFTDKTTWDAKKTQMIMYFLVVCFPR
jgi:hypothetical protein